MSYQKIKAATQKTREAKTRGVPLNPLVYEREYLVGLLDECEKLLNELYPLTPSFSTLGPRCLAMIRELRN